MDVALGRSASATSRQSTAVIGGCSVEADSTVVTVHIDGQVIGRNADRLPKRPDDCGYHGQRSR
ncbi:MAG: hypothetical protein M0Z40_11220 [Actinomycetota bacterium]|jgi:hypothetical protein|nr:hypothetical protein [Actinomycetota bacterium]MDA8185659.1 hypothetical protein [Actinomycetota bacterium]